MASETDKILPAPTTDERLAAVDPRHGRYSGAKDCHIVVSKDNGCFRTM